MTFLYSLFFFLPALASVRSLNVDEAYAFQCLYGTGDMETLISVERDPVRFWSEREEALQAPGATITHTEFCKKFVQEAQEHIAQNCDHSKGKASFRDGEAVDEVLQSVLCDDHPAWPTVQALFYGRACDQLSSRNLRNKEFSVSEKELTELVQGNDIITEDFNEAQRWLSDPCEEFAIIDNVIMYRLGMYLSSAGAPEGRCNYQSHPQRNAFLFSGWEGIIEHDALSHAVQEYKRDCALETLGVSPTELVKRYCGPEHIVPGDIITQSQQHLGWFYNNHEMASEEGAYDPGVLETVLFPYAPNLTDKSFSKIMPFFVKKADWKKTALDPIDTSWMLMSHAHLLRWRNTHCMNGWRVFPKEYFRPGGGFKGGYPKTRWIDDVLA